MLKSVQANPVVAEAGNELGFNGALECIIETLEDGRFNPAIFFTNLTYLGYFPGLKIGYTETSKVAFPVELVDFAEGILEGCVSIRAVQIKHINLVGLQ